MLLSVWLPSCANANASVAGSFETILDRVGPIAGTIIALRRLTLPVAVVVRFRVLGALTISVRAYISLPM